MVKTHIIFAFMISARLFGQSTQNDPVLINPPSPTNLPGPLSKEVVDKLNQMTQLFDGKTLDGWITTSNAWIVKDGAMASTGAGRGVIYTKADYGNFRLIFNMRHV